MAAVFANAWVYKLIPNLEPSRKSEENLSKQLITELYEFESTENSTKSLVQRKACNKVFGRGSSSSVPLVGPL